MTDTRRGNWPAPGWLVHDILPGARVREVRAMPALSVTVEAELDRLWNVAQERAGGLLFNGRVFCTDEIGADLVSGHWTEYRRTVAQMQRPDLFDVLRLRPTAVGGALLAPDGVVFGRRPERAVYQAGMWQLPPAGNLDISCAEPDGTVDFTRHVLTELREEMGMDAGAVRVRGPLCMVEHSGSHVLDIGVALETDLDAAAIARAHAAAPDAEYDVLRIVKPEALAAFLASEGPAVTPQAHAFLARMGLLDAA